MIPAVRLILPFDSSDVLPSLVHLSPIVARITASKPRMRAIIIRARQAWMYPTEHTHNSHIRKKHFLQASVIYMQHMTKSACITGVLPKCVIHAYDI